MLPQGKFYILKLLLYGIPRIVYYNICIYICSTKSKHIVKCKYIYILIYLFIYLFIIRLPVSVIRLTVIYMLVPISRVKNAWPLKMEQIGSPETLVMNYNYEPINSSEEQFSYTSRRKPEVTRSVNKGKKCGQWATHLVRPHTFHDNRLPLVRSNQCQVDSFSLSTNLSRWTHQNFKLNSSAPSGEFWHHLNKFIKKITNSMHFF